MINSLNPKAMAVTRIETEVRTAPEEKDVKPSLEKHWLQPDPSWDRGRFEVTLMHAIFIEDKDSEQAIDQAYLATEETKDITKRTSWEAYHEIALLRMGKGGHLTTLDQLAIAHPDNADVLKYRAQGYQQFGEHEKAVHFFEVAAQKIKDELGKLEMYGDAAIAFATATRHEQVQRIVEKMKSVTPFQQNHEVTLLYLERNRKNREVRSGLLLLDGETP